LTTLAMMACGKKCRVWEKVPGGSTPILGDTQILLYNTTQD